MIHTLKIRSSFFSLLAVLLAILLISSCGDSQQRNSTLIFSGVCDGSAAVRIGRNKILVAYDEMNSLFAFDAEGGSFERSIPLKDILQLTDNDEMDLEAAVVHNDGVWWIGSHGLDSSADPAPNRRVLFKTSLPEQSAKGLAGIRLQDGPYDIAGLISESLPDNANDDSHAKDLAPKKGGINVEGLSVTAEGNLLVALRSPLTEGLVGDAVVLELSKSQSLFDVVRSHHLHLGDKGIRDIVISANGYLLIAGSVKSGGDFSVFRWQRTKNAGDIQTGDIEEVFTVPEGLNAEALVDMGSYWLLLSDDGKVNRADSETSDGDRICDNIVRNNPRGQSHKSVFFRGIKFSEK